MKECEGEVSELTVCLNVKCGASPCLAMIYKGDRPNLGPLGTFETSVILFQEKFQRYSHLLQIYSNLLPKEKKSMIKKRQSITHTHPTVVFTFDKVYNYTPRKSAGVSLDHKFCGLLTQCVYLKSTFSVLTQQVLMDLQLINFGCRCYLNILYPVRILIVTHKFGYMKWNFVLFDWSWLQNITHDLVMSPRNRTVCWWTTFDLVSFGSGWFESISLIARVCKYFSLFWRIGYFDVQTRSKMGFMISFQSHEKYVLSSNEY